MGITEIIGLLSGVALFLFGMSVMGDGLKKASGNKLEPILYRLTSTLPKAVLLGAGVTAVIQSSCATTVMVVGFVNSGMMKVRQGINVILGAILGTSITGWIICLSYIEGAEGFAKIISTATLTGVVALVGIIIKMFAKKQMIKNVGDILLGFAVLMFGMSTMSGAVSGLGEQEWFRNGLTSMSNPLLGILVGAAFTALLQSASAAVGIIQALSMTGVMSFESALPLLMGVCFGASLPVILSAIGANTGGKRTAMVYPIATGGGAIITAAIFYILNAIFNFEFTQTIMNPFSLAFVNTILRLAILLILLPFTEIIESLVTVLIRDKDEVKTNPAQRLEERFITHPALAIEQSRMTVNDMAELSQEAVKLSFELLDKFDAAKFEKVKQLESTADEYEDALGSYLVKLTRQEMTKKQNEDVSLILHTLSDFESISDLAVSIALRAKTMNDNGYEFSSKAEHEIHVLCAAVSEIVSLTKQAFVENSISLAVKVEPLEEYIDHLRDTIKSNYVARLKNEECTLNQGIVFSDIITNLERVSDQCSKIAVAMIELGADSYDTHEYLNTVRKKQGKLFQSRYDAYEKRFSL